MRQVEDFYVARYWSLLDKLSPRTLRGIGTPALNEREEMAIRLYFRLSEDEADLRAQGWVSDDTWRDWSGAISSQMRRPPFDRIWAETCEDSAAGRDYEFRHLRRGCGTTPAMTLRRLAPSEGACAGLRGDGPDRQHRNGRRCSCALLHHKRTR